MKSKIPFGLRGRAWLLDGSRRCAHCQKWLKPSAFPPNPKMRDGLGSWCRECVVGSTREWRAKHRTANLSRRRELWAAHRDQVNAHRRELYATRKAA